MEFRCRDCLKYCFVGEVNLQHQQTLSTQGEEWKRMEPLKAVIAEDEQLTRTIIRARLEKLGHVVVAEAGDGVQAIEATRLHKPDVVIMDIKMPVMDGIEAAKTILAEAPCAILF